MALKSFPNFWVYHMPGPIAGLPFIKAHGTRVRVQGKAGDHAENGELLADVERLLASVEGEVRTREVKGVVRSPRPRTAEVAGDEGRRLGAPRVRSSDGEVEACLAGAPS